MGNSQKDKGYAWIICAASFMAHLLFCNLHYSRGMFYIIFSRNIEGSSAAISLVPSINTALTFGFGITMLFLAPITGLLVSKLGAQKIGILGGIVLSSGLILASRATHVQHLYWTYGVLCGIGASLTYNPCLSVLPEHFDKRFGLATGIATSGCGFGFVIFQYFIKLLDDEYGWRGTLLICGAIELNHIVCGALYIPLQTPKTKKSIELLSSQEPACGGQGRVLITTKDDDPIATVQSTYKNDPNMNHKLPRCMKHVLLEEIQEYIRLLKNPIYMLFSIGEIFNVVADSIIFTHMGAYAMSLGFTKGDAALLFTILGITNTFMRIISGTAAQRVHPLWLCTLTASLLAVITFLLGFLTSLPLLTMYVAFFGGLVAPYQCLPVMVTAEVVDSDMLPRAMGFQILLLAPGSLLGPLFAGFIYDRTGNYMASFYIASGFLCLSGCSALLAMVLKKLCLNNRHSSTDVHAEQKDDSYL